MCEERYTFCYALTIEKIERLRHSWEIINFDEIKKLYDENEGKEGIISTQIMLKDFASEKLYIDFNV